MIETYRSRLDLPVLSVGACIASGASDIDCCVIGLFLSGLLGSFPLRSF